MKEEQDKAPDMPSDQPTPYQFYRKLHPTEEAMLTGLLEEHPKLSREKALQMLESAGF